MKRTEIFIAAGGTGGHINAALALGEKKASVVTYFSGQRYLDYKLFKGMNCIHLNATSLRFKKPLSLIKALLNNLLSFLYVFKLTLKRKPRFVIGAGGYVCGPVLLAAYLLRIPVFIIEQNAVMGLTNKILSRLASKVFLHFENTKGITKKIEKKCRLTGNPIRSEILEKLQKSSLNNASNDCIKLLAFGGSLGALQINGIIKELCHIFNTKKLEIHHQVGKGKEVEIKSNTGIFYRQYNYIDDMASEYAWADVILARAGASTISELEVVQKPCVLVPFPFATDNHQYYNALELKKVASFPVLILDQQKDTNELAKELKNYLIARETFEYTGGLKVNAAEKILNEVEKCLE